MRRAFSTLLLIAFGVVAMAQSSFTIVRPTDGSKVREQVKIQIPISSLSDGDYVGIFVGGKFVEAVAPLPAEERKADDKYFVYVLDTKKRGIPDGPVKLEAVQYSSSGGTPIIKERTSIDVNVENSASIPVPEDGFKIRYKFVAGKRYTYKLEQLVAYSSISDKQKQLGGTPSEKELESETLRMEYEVVNNYPNGNGLIRIQPLPMPGKDKVFLRTTEDPDGQQYDLVDMQPLYMMVNSTGREEFGSVPPYSSTTGANQSISNTLLLAPYPLPILPVKRLQPGDPYSTGFQVGSIDLTKMFETKSLSSMIPGDGQLVSVEWEDNHPCAKLVSTLELGAKSTEGQKLFNRANGDVSAQKIEETIYFALDLGMVIKMVRNMTVDIKGTVVETGGGPGTGGTPGGGPPGGGGPPAMGGLGNLGGGSFQNGQRKPPNMGEQGGGPPAGVPGPRGGSPNGGPPGGNGQFGRGARGGNTGGGSTTIFQRIRLMQTFTLIK